VATLLIERTWPGFALILAALAWLVTALVAYVLVTTFSHLLGEQQYLPD
jgi:hypothetical protein